MKWTQISTTAHLRQFVSHAVVVGFLSPLSLTSLNFVLRSLSPLHSLLFYSVLRCQGISPDNYTIPFVLQAVGRLRCPKSTRVIQAESFKFGFPRNVFVQNSLVSAYFQCGMVSEGRKVFEFMREDMISDVVSWNSVMSGYLHNDQFVECLEIMRNCGEVSDSVTFVNGLVGCGRTGRVALGRQIHGRVISNGLFGRDFYLGSSLIDMYVKFGLLEDARRSFDEMTLRNVVVWTSMISGYTDADMFVEALDLFRLMQGQGLIVDDTVIACVISACAHLGALDHGKWVHTYCASSTTGLVNSIKVKCALVDMYSKCGDIETALSIFRDTKHGGDVYLWTAMICGLAMNGRADEALCLFSEMETSRTVIPNEITFLGVLSACCHRGLVDRGFHYLHLMVHNYDLKPRIQHFGCIVDLLGRAKLVREAEEFINKVPLKPDAVIWRSLLFACRRNGDIDKAEEVAKTIMELEDPCKGEVQVMLSNVYASASKWTDANSLRRKMKDSGFQKQPGCSFIEMDGIVHEFLVADQLHPQIEVIHETLLRLKDHVFSQEH